jgi:hypothetical protein
LAGVGEGNIEVESSADQLLAEYGTQRNKRRPRRSSGPLVDGNIKADGQSLLLTDSKAKLEAANFSHLISYSNGIAECRTESSRRKASYPVLGSYSYEGTRKGLTSPENVSLASQAGSGNAEPARALSIQGSRNGKIHRMIWGGGPSTKRERKDD